MILNKFRAKATLDEEIVLPQTGYFLPQTGFSGCSGAIACGRSKTIAPI
ncbi:hypothetical protein GS597_19315 [Synechococcales cyanobacterium C]|uniref:Uncharacterized protein n=1 Tax=Petrachloros mirabilis ULC683 TaxID=2781853 RepID=A0A8K2A2I4_9CYAN|nr:hypothetical protein [Petrachloros mirabilis]NCJ08618.1 hypothetical protein [Petrachloros mirabilis ULC683]